MALYSAEIVFRDGTQRALEYEAMQWHSQGMLNQPIDYVRFLRPGGRVLDINLDTVQTMETWQPVSPVAEDIQ